MFSLDGCCKENADLQKCLTQKIKKQGRSRSEVGQHVCQVCGKRYKKKAVLNIHMQSHSNVKVDFIITFLKILVRASGVTVCHCPYAR